MAGNIDETDHQAARQIEVSETKVNGYPAFLLLDQAICIDACQRANKRRLSVIDMPGSSDQQAAPVGHISI